MKCPKCGFSRSISDRVCRRCKYLFDEDRFIATTPPRSGQPATAPFVAVESSAAALFRRLRGQPAFLAPVSLIPGLGHALSGHPRRGFFFFSLVLVLASLSVLLFARLPGQVLFGLAVSAHSYCIFELTPWARSADVRVRAGAMGILLIGLLALYWPLLTLLANIFIPSRRVDGDRYGTGAGDGRTVTLIVLFAASVALSAWIGRRLASRHSGTGT